MYSIILTTIILYVCSIFHIDHQGDKHYIGHKPLYDIIHNNLPDLSNYQHLNDYLALIPFILFLQSNKRTEIIKKFFSYFTVIILFRCITTSVTIIPASDPQCKTKKRGEGLWRKLKGQCYDKIFSGHTAWMLLSAFLLIEYNLLPNIPNQLLYMGVTLFTLLLVVTKVHYTVDVILSALITYFVYDSGLKLTL